MFKILTHNQSFRGVDICVVTCALERVNLIPIQNDAQSAKFI